MSEKAYKICFYFHDFLHTKSTYIYLCFDIKNVNIGQQIIFSTGVYFRMKFGENE